MEPLKLLYPSIGAVTFPGFQFLILTPAENTYVVLKKVSPNQGLKIAVLNSCNEYYALLPYLSRLL